MADTIVLGGQSFNVEPVPFGRLRKLIASFNRARSFNGDLQIEEMMAESSEIFALLLNKTTEEIDALPISVQEMALAMSEIPAIIGLVQKKEPQPGE